MKRRNDAILMDECLRNNFTKTETRRINNVRIYLRVETLSDMCNASGTEIHESVFRKTDKTILPFNLNFKNGMSTSTTLWPRQAKPGPKSFEAWNRFIRQFHVPHKSKLKRPLGEWITIKSPTQERKWLYNYDPHSDMIFERISDEKCQFFQNFENKRRNLRVSGGTIIDSEPEDAIPVDKISEETFSIFSGIYTQSSQERTIETWEDYVSSLEPWEKDLINGVECYSIAEVAESLQNSETFIKIASDGGAALGHGSFGWIIGHSPEHIVARHKGTVRGFPIASRRAQAYGGLSFARFIFRVLSFFNITDFGADMRWFCDSRDVIKRFYDYSPTPWNHYSHKIQGDHDVIIQLYYAWEEIDSLRGKNNGNRIEINLVKSHQDDHKTYENLNDAAKFIIIITISTKFLYLVNDLPHQIHQWK